MSCKWKEGDICHFKIPGRAKDGKKHTFCPQTSGGGKPISYTFLLILAMGDNILTVCFFGNAQFIFKDL